MVLKLFCLTGNGILERSFPMQFLSKFQRLSLTIGLGGMVWRLLARVGTISPLRKLAAGPDGIYTKITLGENMDFMHIGNV